MSIFSPKLEIRGICSVCFAFQDPGDRGEEQFEFEFEFEWYSVCCPYLANPVRVLEQTVQNCELIAKQ